MDLRILNAGCSRLIQQEKVMLNVLLGSTAGIMSLATVVLSTVVVVGWTIYMINKANKHE